jgi:MFS family permease
VLKRLGPLVEPNFRRLWLGRTTSAVGDALSGVALVFAVLGISDSAADLGFVMAAFMVPRVAFLLVGGVWADRVPRRLLMVGADVTRAVVQGGLAIAILTGNGTLWVFVAGALLSGAASAFFGPAIIGLIPQAISPARLQAGNALLNLSESAAHMAGPVVAGILVALMGAGWIFAIDAASFAISAIFLMRLVIPAAAPAEHKSFLGDLADGWREVTSRRWLVGSLAAFAFGNLAFAAFFVLGPLVVNRDLGGAPAWGLLMSAFGFGGLAGGAIALRWKPERPLVATFATLLLAPAALLLLAQTPPLAVLGIGVVLLAAAIAICNTLWHTTLQQQVPEESISRVSSYDWMVSLLIFPAGAALAGPLADAFGVELALFAFAALAAIPQALVLGMSSVRAVRRLDTAPPKPAAAGEAEAVSEAAIS